MKKVQVFTVIKGSLGNAGPKAPLDICRILEAAGDAESFLLSCDQGWIIQHILKLFPI